MKILAGLERPDAGKIVIDGQEVQFHRPLDATKHGLSFLHQELNLVPSFTATQNMGLGYQQSRRLGVLDRRAIRRRAHEVMQRLDPQLDLSIPVARLTVSQRWIVALGRSLMREARVIAMDEPTASFTAQECERVFAIVRDLTAAASPCCTSRTGWRRCSDLSTTSRCFATAGWWPAARGTIDRSSLTEEIVGREVEQVATIRAARWREWSFTSRNWCGSRG